MFLQAVLFQNSLSYYLDIDWKEFEILNQSQLTQPKIKVE